MVQLWVLPSAHRCGLAGCRKSISTSSIIHCVRLSGGCHSSLGGKAGSKFYEYFSITLWSSQVRSSRNTWQEQWTSCLHFTLLALQNCGALARRPHSDFEPDGTRSAWFQAVTKENAKGEIIRKAAEAYLKGDEAFSNDFSESRSS